MTVAELERRMSALELERWKRLMDIRRQERDAEERDG